MTRRTRRVRPGEALRIGLAWLALLTAVGVAGAQVRVGGPRVRVENQRIETLKFELHSVNDDVTIYAGGPRELLLLEVHPSSMPPRVDLGPGPHPTLRVRDLSLYDGTGEDDPVYLDGDPYQQDSPVERVPESQSWEAILTALVPTDFYLDVEEGKGHFDLSDMYVQNLHVLSHQAKIIVEFSRPNDGELKRFQLIADGGEIELREFLNARPRQATIQTEESECDIQITGKAFEGEAEIYFTGTPDRMQFEISRKIGVRIEGPAATVAKFDAKHMERRGLALYSKNYDEQRCKILLHFVEPLKDLDVEWD